MSFRARTASAFLVAVAGLVAVTSCGASGQETLGELVMFEAIEVIEYSGQAAELTSGQQPRDVLDEVRAGRAAERGQRGALIADLPPPDDGVRRFAFVHSGCVLKGSAQLVLEDNRLDAQLLEDGSTEQRTMCEQQVYFLSVFDVPVGDLPDHVRLS